MLEIFSVFWLVLAVVLGVITAGCIMITLTHVGINLFS